MATEKLSKKIIVPGFRSGSRVARKNNVSCVDVGITVVNQLVSWGGVVLQEGPQRVLKATFDVGDAIIIDGGEIATHIKVTRFKGL